MFLFLFSSFSLREVIVVGLISSLPIELAILFQIKITVALTFGTRFSKKKEQIGITFIKLNCNFHNHYTELSQNFSSIPANVILFRPERNSPHNE